MIDNTTRSSPTRFHAPNPRFATAALAPTRLPDSSITKNARTQPAVPLIGPCDRDRDSSKNIGSENWPLNNARKPENKTVHWEGISASISSSYGFQIWAEKLAMLNGEVKSGSVSSPIPPVKQNRERLPQLQLLALLFLTLLSHLRQRSEPMGNSWEAQRRKNNDGS